MSRFWLLLILLGATAAHAQDRLPPAVDSAVNPSPGAAAAPQPTTPTAGPESDNRTSMPLDQFEILLKPYAKDELAAFAKTWRESLQVTATEIAHAKVLALRKGSIAVQDKLAELTARQKDTANRLTLIIDALQAKGGDGEELQAYLQSVTSENLGDNPVKWSAQLLLWLKSPEGGVRWGLRLAGFLACLLVARIVGGVLGGLIERALRMSKVKMSDLLLSFFVTVARNGALALGLVVGLSVLGVPVGPFLAAMGAVGFIVGFALQDTLGNFASGLMILLYRPYDLEDFVNVAGVAGKVQSMSLVSTTLLTPDNQKLVIPNSSIWGGIITNVTGSPTRRVDLTFGIGYGDDMQQAQEVIEELVASHPLILQDPAPVVRVHELADSSVNFVCRPWVKTADYWSVYWDLTRMVKEAFDQEGISIPFPQQDVHMHPAPPAAPAKSAA